MSYLMKWVVSILAFLLVYRFCKTRDTSTFHGFLTGLEKKEYVGGWFQRYEESFRRLNLPFNRCVIVLLFVLGGIVAKVIYGIVKEVFVLSSVSYIISLPFFFFGFAVVNFLGERKKAMMEVGLNDFLIQLKSALKVNSDIIEALRRIQNNAMEPFQGYLKQMLNEINSGKLPEQALRDFASRVGIEKFSLYIEHLRFCHIYGGDVLQLTERTQEMIAAAMKEKKRRNRETNDVCNVLYILIAIDLFMYKSFLMGNEYYFQIMTRSFVGMFLVNMNFISIWLMLLLSKFIRKLDY